MSNATYSNMVPISIEKLSSISKYLSPEQIGKIVLALAEYAKTGENHTENLDDVSVLSYGLLKENVEYYRQMYVKKVESISNARKTKAEKHMKRI